MQSSQPIVVASSIDAYILAEGVDHVLLLLKLATHLFPILEHEVLSHTHLIQIHQSISFF
jgi:hypothetical protein